LRAIEVGISARDRKFSHHHAPEMPLRGALLVFALCGASFDAANIPRAKIDPAPRPAPPARIACHPCA